MEYELSDEDFEPVTSPLLERLRELSSGARLKLEKKPDEECFQDLSCQSLTYFHWLRIVILRALLHTPAQSFMDTEFKHSTQMLATFMGMPNLQSYCEQNAHAKVRKRLLKVLKDWESEHGSGCQFPAQLQQNLSTLAHLASLSTPESELLGLCIILVTEPIGERLCNAIGTLAGHRVDRCLAAMLGFPVEAVAGMISKTGTLYSTALLQFEPHRELDLKMLIDLLTDSFAHQMLKPQKDIRVLLQQFIEPVSIEGQCLELKDYEHVQEEAKLCLGLLAGALKRAHEGINILIWGPPGSGKTEFAKMIAKIVQAQLLEVRTQDASGDPITPSCRVRNYRVAQRFYRGERHIILFDECEEVLPSQHFAPSDEVGYAPRKSWINKTLETNPIPTIWIANSLENFDQAYIRRFSMCLEMPAPPMSRRREMVERCLGSGISESTSNRICGHNDITPGILSKTAQMLSLVQDITPEGGAAESIAQRDEQIIRMLSGTLKAQGKAPIAARHQVQAAHEAFELQWLNTDIDLQALCAQLHNSRSARLCLHGMPGTGKTAFGKWLAKELGMPHLSFKASDLIGPYLGETEQKIAMAFESARSQEAVLQFDEVDSFLQERSTAYRHWETTQVNQMLTELDQHCGIFIASTNLHDSMDKASLRRFDITIEFYPLKPEVAHAMFVRTCIALGLHDAQQIQPCDLIALGPLTAGDFDQLQRKHQLLKPASPHDVLDSLGKAVRYKNAGHGRPIGFLAEHRPLGVNRP